ncbi:PspC domain-containing protein [Aquihabitans sp. McL0605]|uniref:PspC domain-containing protein n=1 Tax=Aquihabitans sp. McL0605 TaxID=3415671 RepID=UPI003CEF0DAE
MAPDTVTDPFTDTTRRLRRASTDRHLAGVAGGVARYLGISPLLVRLAFVVVAVVSLGVGLSLYAAAWLLLPDDEDDEAPAVRWFRDHGSDTGAIVLLVVLVAVAIVAITGLASVVHGGDVGAVPFLVGLGIVGYLIATRSTRAEPAAAAASAIGSPGDATLVAPPAVEPMRLPLDPEVVARRARQRSVRNTTVLAALLVGGAGTVLWATGAWRASGWVVPAAVLVVLLIGLGAGVVVGWSWTVALLTLLVTPVLVVALIPGVHLRAGVGTRLAAPATAGEIAPSYRLGIGHQEVDLSDLALRPGSSTTVRVAVGIGTATIRVPAEAVVHLQGHVSAGTVLVDGADVDLEGTDVRVDRILPATSTGPAERAAPRLYVVVKVGIGQADVIRSV